ncbi:MAG: redoxin domain-containing protein [bacterium]|nr:redoxin domain-containing protein [bacterium]
MTLALAASGTLPTPPASSGARLFVHVVVDEELQEILDEYDEAVDAWEAERRAASGGKERRALKDRHPVKTFYARIEALAKQGNGAALLWNATHVQDFLKGTKKIRAAKAELFDRLVDQFAEAEWSEDIALQLDRQKRWFEAGGIAARLEALSQKSTRTETVATSLEKLASRLRGRKATPEDLAKSEALRDRVLAEMGETKAADRVRDERRKEKYKVGNTPPDFTTTDTDGVEFKLSDYRGKVVLLDFWGFW